MADLWPWRHGNVQALCHSLKDVRFTKTLVRRINGCEDSYSDIRVLAFYLGVVPSVMRLF